MTQNIEFLKLAAVIGRTGKSRSSIYAAVKSGDFPAPVNIGQRAVAWPSTAITEWQQRCLNAPKSA
jgi:prophage regulatory protein